MQDAVTTDEGLHLNEQSFAPSILMRLFGFASFMEVSFPDKNLPETFHFPYNKFDGAAR